MPIAYCIREAFFVEPVTGQHHILDNKMSFRHLGQDLINIPSVILVCTTANEAGLVGISSQRRRSIMDNFKYVEVLNTLYGHKVSAMAMSGAVIRT